MTVKNNTVVPESSLHRILRIWIIDSAPHTALEISNAGPTQLD